MLGSSRSIQLQQRPPTLEVSPDPLPTRQSASVPLGVTLSVAVNPRELTFGGCMGAPGSQTGRHRPRALGFRAQLSPGVPREPGPHSSPRRAASLGEGEKGPGRAGLHGEPSTEGRGPGKWFTRRSHTRRRQHHASLQRKRPMAKHDMVYASAGPTAPDVTTVGTRVPSHCMSKSTKQADLVQDQATAPQLAPCLGSEGGLRVQSSETLDPSFHHSEGRPEPPPSQGTLGAGLLP